MQALKAWWKAYGYVLSLLLAAALGTLLPGPGSKGGVLHLDIITLLGVMLVFFLHGAGMSVQALRHGAMQWRLHVFVQGTTFILFPLVGAIVFWLGRNVLPLDIRLGFFYLCALPSTMTSSVALTAMAGGNLPAAVFNATLSGLLAMPLTPLLMSLVVNVSGQSMSFVDALLKVCVWLLLPLMAGLFCHRWLGAFLHRHKPRVGQIDRAVILMIVYAAFCDSALSGAWSSHSLDSMAMLLLMVLGLIALAYGLIGLFARRLGFGLSDEVVAVFCGGQKSLANGMPMANVMLAGHPGLGVIVLPMILYHQIQLLLGSVLVHRFNRRKAQDLARPEA